MGENLDIQLERMETLTQDIRREASAELYKKVQDLINIVVEYQKEGLTRIFKLIGANETNGDLFKTLVKDPLVNSLLVLYDLHPESLSDRVEALLDQIRPELEKHSGTISIVSESEGKVILRIESGCSDCSSSMSWMNSSLKARIEKILFEGAPDLTSVEFEGKEFNVQCELCNQNIKQNHKHLLELPSQAIICSCTECSILFDRSGAKNYLRIPDKIQILKNFTLSDELWDRLAVPVKLAFFYKSSTRDRVCAFYPSPAGATESLLSLDGWESLVTENPILLEFEPDVEALLVDRIQAPGRYFRVPIDESFKLVGLFRKDWTGFSGGTKVWDEVKLFFNDLASRAVL